MYKRFTQPKLFSFHSMILFTFFFFPCLTIRFTFFEMKFFSKLHPYNILFFTQNIIIFYAHTYAQFNSFSYSMYKNLQNSLLNSYLFFFFLNLFIISFMKIFICFMEQRGIICLVRFCIICPLNTFFLNTCANKECDVFYQVTN